MITDVVVLDALPALAEQVEALCADLEANVRVTAVDDAAEVATAARPPCVLVVGPSVATPSGLAKLERVIRRLPGVDVVLAFGELPDVPVQDLIATGAKALVDPDDRWELRATLSAAIDRTSQLAHVLEQVRSGAVRAPKVFTVCSPTGGCGKTFYASNLAYLLATTGDIRVALVDLDLQFGEVTAAMRVRGRHTVADAVDIRDDRELQEMLPELLIEHPSGVHVLPAPRDPAIADTIEPADVTRIIDALTEAYDVVVVDTPTGLTEPVLASLDRSDHLFLVAALDLASLRNLRLFVETLHRLRLDDERISLVLNKEARDTGIDVRDLKQVFPRGFASRIPFDREVARLMNHGTPVLEGAASSPVAASLVEGMLPFLDDRAAAVARERFLSNQSNDGLRGLVGRIGRRRPAESESSSGPSPIVPAVHGGTR